MGGFLASHLQDVSICSDVHFTLTPSLAVVHPGIYMDGGGRNEPMLSSWTDTPLVRTIMYPLASARRCTVCYELLLLNCQLE